MPKRFETGTPLPEFASLNNIYTQFFKEDLDLVVNCVKGRFISTVSCVLLSRGRFFWKSVLDGNMTFKDF